MSSISFNKEQLAGAFSEFGNLKSTCENNLKTIEGCLTEIDGLWKGPIHDSANTDKINAIDNMKKAKSILDSMQGSIETLSTNASKVTY